MILNFPICSPHLDFFPRRTLNFPLLIPAKYSHWQGAATTLTPMIPNNIAPNENLRNTKSQNVHMLWCLEVKQWYFTGQSSPDLICVLLKNVFWPVFISEQWEGVFQVGPSFCFIHEFLYMSDSISKVPIGISWIRYNFVTDLTEMF